jgi:hypothetical protein
MSYRFERDATGMSKSRDIQAELRGVLETFMAGFRELWKYCEHGKGFVGNWILDAMRQHGMDVEAELRRYADGRAK